MASDISQELRARVARRAKQRCEYCLIHRNDAGFPHQVDHIVGRKHGGASDFNNLAYACVICNRHKGSDVTSIDLRTGEIARLYNPRSDHWADHFQLNDLVIEPISNIGWATARLLRFNTAERISERKLLRNIGRYP